ncbi:MAG: insulinase family protein, partial [Mariprofundaceae bacterium]|nr:insulinase family protein [Mariprofundaceae bacterium]
GLRKHVLMPTRQITVQMARLGPSRFDDAFFADMLLNHMLGGGGFASQLMEQVREKRGLVYGVYSYFIPLAVPGPYVISLQTRADQAEQALDVVRAVLRDMHDGKISASALKAAKANLAGGFAHRLDSNAKRVGLMSMMGFYGLPLDYLQVWEQRINSVTLAAVKAEAKRFLDAAQWNIIEAGPAKGDKVK